MDEREREKAFEALLAHNLRAAEQTSAGECPDADILAAYFEQSIDETERAHWEKHFAACAACQRALAALAKSGSVEPVEATDDAVVSDLAWLRVAAVPPPMPAAAAAPRAASSVAAPRLETRKQQRSFLDWRWLVPAAGMAAAVVLWIAIRPSRQHPIEVARNADLPVVTTPPPAPEPQNAQSPATHAPRDKKGPETDLSAISSESKDGRVPSGGRREAGATKRLGASARTSPEVTDRRSAAADASKPAGHAAVKALGPTRNAPARQPGAQPSSASAAAPAQRKEQAAEQFQAEKRAAGQQVPGKQKTVEVEPQAPSAPEVAAKSTEDRNRAQSQNQDGFVAGAVAPAPPRALNKAAKTEEARASHARGEVQQQAVPAMQSSLVQAPWVLVLGPSAVARWRVRSAGAIERWNAATRSWEAQASGVTADLLAGSAVSERLCWVVGRDGTVLRTTDGVHWERITSPAPVDWVGVSARDAVYAVLTSPSGLRYTTSDGGRNWRALPLR